MAAPLPSPPGRVRGVAREGGGGAPLSAARTLYAPLLTKSHAQARCGASHDTNPKPIGE